MIMLSGISYGERIKEERLFSLRKNYQMKLTCIIGFLDISTYFQSNRRY